jgi:hypothetical protein
MPADLSVRPVSDKIKPVWVGDAVSAGISSDLRAVMDYLIRGLFKHFGKDTGKQVKHIFQPESQNTTELPSVGG